VRIIESRPEEELAAAMIDGYAPTREEFLEEVWWQLRAERKLPSAWFAALADKLYQARRRPRETTYLTLYRSTKAAIELAFCPFQEDEHRYPPHHRQPRCVGQSLTTGSTAGTIEVKYRKPFSPKTLARCLPALQEEYRYNEECGRLPYVQHLLVWNTSPDKGCPHVTECYENWMRPLRFTEKTDSEYLNLEAFTAAWRVLLNEAIDAAPTV